MCSKQAKVQKNCKKLQLNIRKMSFLVLLHQLYILIRDIDWGRTIIRCADHMSLANFEGNHSDPSSMLPMAIFKNFSLFNLVCTIHAGRHDKLSDPYFRIPCQKSGPE